MTEAAKYPVALLQAHPTLYFVFAIAAAAGLYYCRSCHQHIYGVIEIFVGIYLVELSISSTGAFSQDFSQDFDVVRNTVQITTYLGAIFVIVRGFDNIKRGHKAAAPSNRFDRHS